MFFERKLKKNLKYEEKLMVIRFNKNCIYFKQRRHVATQRACRKAEFWFQVFVL